MFIQWNTVTHVSIAMYLFKSGNMARTNAIYHATTAEVVQKGKVGKRRNNTADKV